MSELREALTAAGATALVPKIIQKAVLEYQRRYAPVVAAIPTVKWDTDVFFYNRRDANPNGGAVQDGGARVMSNSVYNQAGFPMKHLQIQGGVTGYAQAVTSGEVGDLLGKEVDGALKGHYWDMECFTMWGSAAATVNGANPIWDGFDNVMNTYTGTLQNAIDFNGAAFTLGALDQLADLLETQAAMSVFDSSWMYVLSNTAYSRISQLIVNNQRFIDKVEVAAGLIVPTYRNIPLMKTSFLSARGFSMAPVATATATTGGALGATLTYKYVVTAIINRQGETLPCAEVTQATGAGTTNTITLSFTPPSGLDGLSALLYKVYRTAAGGATGTETLLGIVDATVGLDAANNPIPATSIIDTGITLVPANGATIPQVITTAYPNQNAAKKPPAQNLENIFLVPRNEDFMCRPYVREAARLPVATTVLAPDTMPFVLQTDTTVAYKGQKYLGGLYRVDTHLN